MPAALRPPAGKPVADIVLENVAPYTVPKSALQAVATVFENTEICEEQRLEIKIK